MREYIERFANYEIAVNVETKREWKEFLKTLEKETSFTWSNGKKPTKFKGWSDYKEKSCILLFKDIVYYGPNRFLGKYEIIKYKDLIKEKV